jgi:hypothetical protein
MLEQIKALDSKGDRGLPPHKSGDIEDPTPFGMRFESSCSQMLDSAADSRKKQLASLSATISAAFYRVLRCRSRYPELDSWIRQWISSARRQNISCANEAFKGTKFDASNAYNDHTTLSKDAFEMMIGASSTDLDKDTIALIPLSGIVGSFIHEIFHSTGANNRFDHNDLQLRLPRHHVNERTNLDVVECNDDIAQDRINLIESLCTDRPLPDAKQNAALELSARMAQCPESKGCVGVFSNDTFSNQVTLGTSQGNPNQVIPSEKLSLMQSHLLCARIRDRFECQNSLTSFFRSPRDKQEPNLTKKMSGNSDFLVVIKELRKRLEKITPAHTNELPGELLKADSSALAEFKTLETDSCFRSLFRVAPSGNYFFETGDLNGVKIENFTFSGSLSDHIKINLLPFLVKFSMTKKNCNDSDVPKRVAKALTRIQEKLETTSVVDNINRYYDLASNDFRGPLPNLGERFDYMQYQYADIGPVIFDLLGKDFLIKLQSILMHLHPKSPDFDCSAAGFSAYTAAELARQNDKILILSPNSCPH